MNKKTLLIFFGIFFILKGIISLTGAGSLISQSTANGFAMLLLGGMGIIISQRGGERLGPLAGYLRRLPDLVRRFSPHPYPCLWL